MHLDSEFSINQRLHQLFRQSGGRHKMKKNSKLFLSLVFSTLFFLAAFSLTESSAWARAGGGGFSGGRGSRSFSAPSMPSPRSPSSPGITTPRPTPYPSSPSQPSSGSFGRSPFLQGMAGGVAGGLLGSMLFGGTGHASPGATTGGGIGLFDIVALGLVLYLGWRFFRRRRT